MDLINLILYQLLKAIKLLIEILPLKFVLQTGKFLGRFAYTVLPQRKEITINNLQKAFPEKNRRWARRVTREVFENFGRNMMEFIKFSSKKLDKHVNTEGLEKIRDGILLMTGHLGNWEITGMSIVRAGKELYPIGRRIHNPAFDKIVDDIRTALGCSHIPYRGSIKEILSKIKKQKNLCVLIDQRMKTGLPCVFFNRPVWTTHIVSVLHRRTGVKVIPAFSFHEHGKINVKYDDPLDLIDDKDNLKADFVNTQRQVEWLEKKIRNKPNEWFWMHNFWRDKWPAVFIDRDGTINEDLGYVGKVKDLKFIPGVMDALRKLRRAGYLLIVVTNQAGIARGYYTERDYIKVNEYFLKSLKDEGVIIDRVYYCPHHPDAGCSCRKPNPGMIRKACSELNIDLERSFVIGDKASDMNLGKNMNIKEIMVMTGYGKEEIKKVEPYLRADDLPGAARIILDMK
ncbi:D-glycero-beta-D-manno-heptose 1,7-bisphosphate 7-phosphatase [Elusimicrobiota bacterium]